MEKNKIILIVDDEEGIRDTLVSYFEVYNFEVKGASNGKEAIEIYNEFPHEIALIISDINMPIKNGVEFFLELKDKTNYSKPFYFITGGSNVCLSDVEDKVDGLLFKPFAFELIDEIIESL